MGVLSVDLRNGLVKGYVHIEPANSETGEADSVGEFELNEDHMLPLKSAKKKQESTVNLLSTYK